jgi:hypothetical protein
MKDIFCAIGIFLLFPVKNKFRWITVLIMTDSMMEIIHYSFYTTSFETFHMPFNNTVRLLGWVIPVLLLSLADFVMWLYNHRILAFECRFESLYTLADDLPDEKFKSMFKTAWQQKREFKSEF